MRLIDADKLKKKIRHWNYNVTTTTPTFSFVTEEDIDNMPTVDVLEQIRDEIEREADYQDAVVNHDVACGLWIALDIIEKQTK